MFGYMYSKGIFVILFIVHCLFCRGPIKIWNLGQMSGPKLHMNLCLKTFQVIFLSSLLAIRRHTINAVYMKLKYEIKQCTNNCMF